MYRLDDRLPGRSPAHNSARSPVALSPAEELSVAFERWVRAIRSGAPLPLPPPPPPASQPGSGTAWAVSEVTEGAEERLVEREAEGGDEAEPPLAALQRVIQRHPMGLEVHWAL